MKTHSSYLDMIQVFQMPILELEDISYEVQLENQSSK
jgi:hypothetical protein